jgi:hypothetical protein
LFNNLISIDDNNVWLLLLSQIGQQIKKKCVIGGVGGNNHFVEECKEAAK